MTKQATFNEIKTKLGDGPARFASENERSFREQLDALTEDERSCYDTLKKRWEERVEEKKSKGGKSKHSGITLFPDEMYLTFARCSPGLKKFNADGAWKVMKNYDQRFLSATASQLEEQLKTKTLFVVPGLKSKEGGHDMFYMRPSRYFPKETSTETIIDNLGYCMSVLVNSKEKNGTEGIAFLANMDDWSFTNFSIRYCHNFMMMLQGKVPVRVRMFLIVNPPSWFDKIWTIMKPMLAADFRKKVHMIPESQLNDYLTDGFEEYLPDDIGCGKASTEQMVDDFIQYRKFLEEN